MSQLAAGRSVTTKPWLMLGRGAVRRCPRCGAGHLFHRWLRMVDTCPGCSYRFEREEGFFLGALVMNVIITSAAIIAWIVVGFATTLPNAPVTALAIGGGALGAVTPVVSYPFTKTLWTAIDLIMRRSMGESYATVDGTQPGVGRPREPKNSNT